MINQNMRTQPRTLLQILSQFILAFFGWRALGHPPAAPKYLMVGAHHTTSWDLPLTLLVLGALGIRMHWIGKDSMFRGPLGWFFRRLGGMPVNRRESTNFVQQIVDLYNGTDELAIAISPEGTRSKTSYWRTGFYFIAQGANLPIVLAYLDYPSRTGGIGPTLYPSGDLPGDLARIKRFYDGITGLHPERHGKIELRPQDEVDPGDDLAPSATDEPTNSD